jgi:uncharacterized surface protein with fasciclin (FAS1) repeats
VLVTVILLLVTAASAAGCAVSIPGVSQSHVQAYVNAMHDNISATADQQLKSWQEIQEDSNTIRLRYDIYNNTDSMTSTMDLKVKEFQSTSDATNFVNGMNEGYANVVTSNGMAATNNNAYKQAMGHDPGKIAAYVTIDSIIPPKARLIVQTDEFVVYGSGISISGGSVSATPSAPTLAATPNTITRAMSSDSSLSTFVSFLKTANLTGVLDGPGNFTVFAPDNAAFSKVSASTLADLQNNSTALRTVMFYHIIAMKLPSNVFVDSGTITTVSGRSLPYSVSGTKVKVGDATVTKADINANNGVIHIIDNVLMPPQTT